MPRYRINIEYDGTPYCGWQRQDGHPSVQQSIEEVIEHFCQHKVRLFGAGRTDTGVHALAQVAHFELEKQWKPQKIFEATNGVLRQRGENIAITNCQQVDDEFDARFSALKRHYRYRIINRMAPLTLDAERAWWVRFPLDVEAMHEAAQLLIGKHDFTTFRSVDCQAKSPVRTLDVLNVTRTGEEIEITVSSRSFLHNQVRSLAGTLKIVGDGKWNRQDVGNALAAMDRKQCGPVAPACGLYLVGVDY
ncbi:MAG: tRNA pseudouridine(38-40) synthase TruA [Rhizobiaceae bacterium]|nr:tRNA pseudouridine(38-40) synthase TruA [Rhizobiaceae bacterium]